MKQLFQNLSNGQVAVENVPEPARGAPELLVQTWCSVISPGTERALTELASRSMVGKARARPDLARKVLATARDEGVRSAWEKTRARLDDPYPLGYSSSGVVLEAPDGSPASPGEMVSCAGAGFASHAEVVSVPRTLCARVPDGVPAEDAAYATLVAIALHAVRLAEIHLGEVVAVIGLGLLGRLSMQVVAAAGAVPLGLDPDPSRANGAVKDGYWATDSENALEAECRKRTSDRGADAALVTAASKEPDPLRTAIRVARERAVVCVVGDVPIESPRTPLYEKELSVVVARSYGPGRYDTTHEDRGIDYPASYVRWTEGRNLEEALRLMVVGAVRPGALTTHHYPIDEGATAYTLLADPAQRPLGIVLDFPRTAGRDRTAGRVLRAPRDAPAYRRSYGQRPRIGVIGAGVFARSTLLPALAPHADIAGVVTASGATARTTADRFGAQVASTDPTAVLDDSSLDGILIATRHDSHAALATDALRAGKHVFVEKPLAIDRQGLATVEEAARGAGNATLTVGFNRRYAPLVASLLAQAGDSAPRIVAYRVNAGRLPADHWLRDPLIGGGRIVGEVCHFVDLAAYLCGGSPATATGSALGGDATHREDSVVATLAMDNGSLATITYSGLGKSELPKERVEVLHENGAAILDDFRMLLVYGERGRRRQRKRRDKGHRAEIAAFARTCTTGEPSQDLDRLLSVSLATFAIHDAVMSQTAQAF